MPAPVKFVDLFAGAGGFSLGLEDAGWRCLLAADWWPDAAKTFQANHRGVSHWQGDIRELDQRRLNSLLADSPDWVVGGPPCQGFSTVGKRQKSDPRNGLVREFHRVVCLLKPSGFMLENVLGLNDMCFASQVCALFAESGYTVTNLVLRSADYGVPQLRRRVVFVGCTEELRFRGPPTTHAEATYVSVIDAIGDLPPLLSGEANSEYTMPPSSSYQRRMRRGSAHIQGHQASKHPKRLIEAISHIPDGGNRQHIPRRLQPKTGFHNSYSRLDSTKPAVAVTQNMGKPSGTRCIHPFQHRGLTAREGARLQGFPDRYHFLGGVVSQRQQIANAVPPILSKALALAIVDPSRWQSGMSQFACTFSECEDELPHARSVKFDAASP